jgi:hypothetical protein
VINNHYNRFGNYIFDDDFETFNRQFKIFEKNLNDILEIDFKIKLIIYIIVTLIDQLLISIQI